MHAHNRGLRRQSIARGRQPRVRVQCKPAAPANKPLQRRPRGRRALSVVQSPVVDYHGLGHRDLLRGGLLVRPQLNGGTLARLGRGVLARPAALRTLGCP